MRIGHRPLDGPYAESIKPIRNQMRRYTYSSLLDAILRYLNPPQEGHIINDLNRLPWVAERLAIWLFADTAVAYGTEVATSTDVRKLVDQAWRVAELGFRREGEIKNLQLFIRQSVLPQLPYQRSIDTHAFALQIYLIDRMENNSRLRSFLDDRAGMPIKDYFEVALMYWVHSLNRTPWFSKAFVNHLSPLFPVVKQSTFLSSITRSLADLQAQSRARTIQLDEWFQPTYFYQTPCVWHQGSAIPFGRPTLRRYFEALISDWIADSERNDLRQHYDRLIQNYVSESLTRAKVNFIGEDQISRLIPSGKVSDFLVDEPEGVILFEVKNKVLSDAVPSSRDPMEVASRLKATILKGRDQLREAESALLLKPEYTTKKFHRIIVTSSELFLSSAESLADDEPTSSPCWLLSLQGLDLLAEMVGTQTFTVSELLTRFEEDRSNNPAGTTIWLTHYLAKSAGESATLPDHLLKCVDDLIAKFEPRLPRL